VTCVKFASVDADETLVWSAGKDGKVKQWDAKKFVRIQTLEGHTEEIKAIATTSDGTTLISAAHDKSIRLWELSDEIIVLQEEAEREREREYEAKLIDEEDVVPGEAQNREADLAPIKSIDTIKSTESILEAIDIMRSELLAVEGDPLHVPHPLVVSYAIDRLDLFILDVVHKVRSSHLEKSLLMVPLSYVSDILRSLCKCVQLHHKIELACRVILFLVRVHHNQIVNSPELLPIIDELRITLPKEAVAMLDQTGFNLAALKFLQMHIEERDALKLFRNVGAVEAEKAAKKSRKKKKRAKDTAVVRTMA